MSESRRAWGIPVALALVCGLLIYALGPGSSRVPEPEGSASAPRPSFAAPSWSIPASAFASGGTADLPAVPDDQHKPSVPTAPPKIELPAETQMLSEEFIPGTTEWEEVPLLQGTSSVMRIMPARFNVVIPTALVVYVEVFDKKSGKPVPTSKPVVVRFRNMERESDPWIEVTATDDGKGRWTASLQPSESDRPKLLGYVQVEGVVVTPDAGTRRIPTTLIYTKGPRAKMTGKWRDDKKDGHLLIDGEIDVAEEGNFTLMGQIVGPEPARHPIALTRAINVHLAKGTHWMSLRVWGKALHDMGVDGPYQLVNVLLTRDDPATGKYDPDDTILKAHITKPYRAADFSAEPYVDNGPGPVATLDPSQKDKPPALFPAEIRDKHIKGLTSKMGPAPSAPPSITQEGPK
jgi:hypothetical protein